MMIKMWEKINEKFKKYPARMKVAEKMIELGLSVRPAAASGAPADRRPPCTTACARLSQTRA